MQSDITASIFLQAKIEAWRFLEIRTLKKDIKAQIGSFVIELKTFVTPTKYFG